MHCMRFWMKILTSEVYEGRLLRKVAREAVKCGKGVWIVYKMYEGFRVAGYGSRCSRDQEIVEMLRVAHTVEKG